LWMARQQLWILPNGENTPPYELASLSVARPHS
jgi:hypothetical protein